MFSRWTPPLLIQIWKKNNFCFEYKQRTDVFSSPGLAPVWQLLERVAEEVLLLVERGEVAVGDEGDGDLDRLAVGASALGWRGNIQPNHYAGT